MQPLMTTGPKIFNAAKVRLQKALVEKIRVGGRNRTRETWESMKADTELWNEILNHDLGSGPRQSALNKVAFPDQYRDDVKAALEAGNNLNALYSLSLGLSYVEKSEMGKNVTGKRGLKIVKFKKG